jgi:hypothetical protein
MGQNDRRRIRSDRLQVKVATDTELPGGAPSKGSRQTIPGDAGFEGKIPEGSWRLTPQGQGAHLLERTNVRGRPASRHFDAAETPRFYPEGTAENAGKAHLRIHAATRSVGINLQGGSPGLTNQELIARYREAYSNPALDGIRGDLRTPAGNVVARGVTVLEAFEHLLRWGGR